jgi:flagellar hook protein FlgE
MTANLDSSATVGTSFPAQIKIYDSLGNSYEATVNFTKTATNTWSYNITVPDTLPVLNAPNATPAVLNVGSTPSTTTTVTEPLTAVTGAVNSPGTLLTPSSTTDVALGTTTYNWNFGTNGAVVNNVDAATSLTLDGTTFTPPNPPGGPQSLATFALQINNAITANVGGAFTGVTCNNVGGVLTITAPTAEATAMNAASTLKSDIVGTSNVYTFNTGGTVNANSTLTITGQKADGTPASIQVAGLSNGESLSSYITSLSGLLATSGMVNVSVAPIGTNQMSIQGANFSTGNTTLSEDLPANTTIYNFNPSATVDSGTKFTITGETPAGTSVTTTLPTMTANMSIGNYVKALQTQIDNAGGANIPLVGVQVSSQGGQVTLTGPAYMTTTNNMVQDVQATSDTYAFGSSGGVLTTVDPTSNLTITGLTGTGSTATITAPTITANELVSKYATDLQTAVNDAGIGGVTVADTNGVLTITGANLTTAGNVVQDTVASANASGIMTFDSSGNLASPAANVSGITFGGFSDGAAALGMTWNILGASGTPSIGQEDTASAASGTIQNGYPTGEYESFAVGSDGTVSVTYSNGQQQNVGQIALANVANLQGLDMLGNGDYGVTQASGAAAIGISGAGGLGSMEGGALEASNVNISTEFSDLIVAQRAFEANAKSVTTFDTVEQDTINMVH